MVFDPTAKYVSIQSNCAPILNDWTNVFLIPNPHKLRNLERLINRLLVLLVKQRAGENS
jgi:hypothetical protein